MISCFPSPLLISILKNFPYTSIVMLIFFNFTFFRRTKYTAIIPHKHISPSVAAVTECIATTCFSISNQSTMLETSHCFWLIYSCFKYFFNVLVLVCYMFFRIMFFFHFEVRSKGTSENCARVIWIIIGERKFSEIFNSLLSLTRILTFMCRSHYSRAVYEKKISKLGMTWPD